MSVISQERGDKEVEAAAFPRKHYLDRVLTVQSQLHLSMDDQISLFPFGEEVNQNTSTESAPVVPQRDNVILKFHTTKPKYLK